MEIFVWPKDATCTEHYRLFPEKNSKVRIRLPLLFPDIHPGSICQCRNTNCQIRHNQLCSGRAIITELSPNLITPETHSAFRPRVNPLVAI